MCNVKNHVINGIPDNFNILYVSSESFHFILKQILLSFTIQFKCQTYIHQKFPCCNYKWTANFFIKKYWKKKKNTITANVSTDWVDVEIVSTTNQYETFHWIPYKTNIIVIFTSFNDLYSNFFLICVTQNTDFSPISNHFIFRFFLLLMHILFYFQIHITGIWCETVCNNKMKQKREEKQIIRCWIGNSSSSSSNMKKKLGKMKPYMI